MIFEFGNSFISMEKTCCNCKLTLPIDNFKVKKRETGSLQSQCVTCQKEYRRKHYLANKRKYIEKARVWTGNLRVWWKEYKAQFACTICGEKHPACIQFHHPNDDKEDTVSRLVMNGCKVRVLKEIEKCIPLCANCHAKEHWSFE
jgi:hypothetical protein